MDNLLRHCPSAVRSVSPVKAAMTALVLLLSASTGASGSTSTAFSPTVVFASPGAKQVQLQVCNPAGCNTVTRTVVVLDPNPAITVALAGPTTLEVGQLLRLTGNGTGVPPRTFTWRILRGLDVVAEVSGANGYWNSAGFPPGVYVAVLVLANGVGSVQSALIPLILAPPEGSRFYTVNPCRVLDTRSSTALTAADNPRIVQVSGGACGIPANARAVAANLTVVSPSVPSFLTVYPGNYPRPVTSTINFRAGKTLANSAILPLATDGSGTVAVIPELFPGSSVHLLIDVSGYFATPPLLP
jgi:hypothetical protein